jgi:uncharacterized protein (DUF302 family)
MYHFGTVLDGDFEQIEEKVVAALQTEGFGILTEIDVKATLKKKLNIDKRPYKILGACNPPLANQAIEAEPEIGLLLPCNVLVREQENGQINVSFMDPSAVLTLVKQEGVAELAGQVKDKLMQVRAQLGGQFSN